MEETFDLRYDKTAIKDGMSIDVVYEFLTGMGVNGGWVDDGTLLFETICHNHPGEGKHKLYYYDNTKLFNCYTGCGRFDIFELLSKINVREKGEELELNESVEKYIKSQAFTLVGEKVSTTDFNLEPEEYREPVFLQYNLDQYKRLPRAVVKDWYDEGISAETQYKYNVRYSVISGGAVFPHYGINSEIYGIRQRILADEEVERRGKYRPWQYDGLLYSSPLSFYLYGLNFNKKNIRLNKKAIVFEGEKSVMKMDDLLGERNNISTSSFGMHFSKHQFMSLLNLGVEEIVFAFDKQFQTIGDQEFWDLKRVMRNIEDRFGDFGIKLTFILDDENISNYKDSPVDRGFEVFDKLYQNKKEYKDIDVLYPDPIIEKTWIQVDEEEFDIY